MVHVGNHRFETKLCFRSDLSGGKGGMRHIAPPGTRHDPIVSPSIECAEYFLYTDRKFFPGISWTLFLAPKTVPQPLSWALCPHSGPVFGAAETWEE